MRKIYLFFFILSQSFFLNEAYATHALGGDLMYTQISPTEFEVTLRIYRDCNGINLNNNAEIFWDADCGAGSIMANRISNIDITPLCPGLPTACQGGSGSIGIEEHIYTTVLTIPSGCNNITFDYTLCCRNHVITTLIDPGNENIYLSTSHFNVTNVANNSPVFNNYPAPIVCVNQPVVYNHGVFDPDGDSLYFSPNNCYEALNDTVEYLAGFNGTTPLITANPIQINPNTGSITFTPTALQVGVMCILVEEFRNGVKIGETLRDIQFNVIACANVPPVASGINNVPGVDSLNFVISVCENSQICFDLSFSDIDNDNLNVSWNQEIPAATFQVFNNGTQTPTGQFCWLPQASDVGSNFFSINIADDACPLVGSSTYTYTVEVLPNPNTMSLDYSDLVCTGGTGSISLVASTTPDSVYWTPSSSLTVVNDTFVNVSPMNTETYDVLAFFSGSCQLAESATIGISPSPTIQGIANTTNLCAGGTVILNGSGAETYTWSNGVTDNLPFTPPIGITDYIVTGVDSNGCSGMDTVQITVNPLIGINATPSTPLCYGDSLTLSGFGAQTYVWNNGVINGVSFLPPAGSSTYIMTGTDVNGCTAMDTIDVFVNPLPTVSASTSSDSICNGDSIMLTANGADTYIWSNGINNGDFLTPNLGLSTYSVIGTDTYGCENSANAFVYVNPLPVVVISSTGNNLCVGDSVVLSASGASTYSWSHGIMDGQSFLPRIGIDTFSVIGTDFNGCTSENSLPVTTLPLPNVAVSTNGNNICEGESIVLTGNGAQNYSWNNGVLDGQSFNPPIGNTWYVLMGTDANGCMNVDSIEISVNPNPTVSATVSNNNVCENTSITLTANGANTYVWNNGVSQGQSFTPNVGTTNYTVIGTDSNGCEAEDSLAITVYPLPTIQIVASDTEICDGDAVSLTASGANVYSWTNGVSNGSNFNPPLGVTNYTISATDVNGCVSQDSIEVLVNALPNVIAQANDNEICVGSSALVYGSGAQTYVWDNGVQDNTSFIPAVGNTVYTVIGTDSNGCEAQDNIAIQVNALPNITVSASGNNICEGESIVLNGAGALSYVWSNGVVDGQSFVPPVGLTTYAVNATDSNGCSQADSIAIQVNALPNVVANTTAQAVCNGSPVSLTGAGAQTYVWDNGIQDGVSFTPSASVASYEVTGTDANGCVNTDTIALTIYALPNVIAQANDNEICIGSSALVYGSGAQTYVWDNGVQDNTSFIPAVGNTVYTVIGTDSNGCEAQDNIAIQVNALPNITVSASGNNICEGESIVLNGAGALSYVWSNGVVDGQSFVPPVGLTTYAVNATDSNGCSQADSIAIQVNALPNVVANTTAQAVCNGSPVSLTGAGAQTYVWDNGIQDGVSFTPSASVASYEVTGTDANGCVNTDTIALTIYALPNVIAQANDNEICIGSSALVYGSGAQTYVWDNGVQDNTSFIPAVGNTVYTVIGTDSNGCEAQDNIAIQVNALPNITVSASGNNICEGESIVLNGAGALSYVWSNGVVDGQSFVPPVGLTTYAVNATDSNGCSQADSIAIQVNALPNVVANTTAQAVCNGSPVSLTGAGAQTYVWDNGVQDGVSFTPSASVASYEVTGTDANGCVNTDTVALTIYALPNVVANATQSTICNGEEITLFGAGAQSYTWDNGIINAQSFSPSTGSSTYIVTGTDINGCAGTDTITVITNSLPVINITSSNNIVCEDEAVTLNGMGGVSYVWDNGVLDGVSFIPPVGTNTYVVCGYDVNGCDSHDTIQVIVHPKPNLDILYSVNEICAGESATLTGTGAQNYAWNNGVINGQSFVPPTGSPEYTLTGTSSFGCTNQDSILLTVNPLPVIQVATSPSIVCEGSMVSLTASGASTYQWSNGVTNNLPFTPSLGLNSFSVVGTDSNGCQSQLTTNIMVHPLPAVLANTSDNDICEGTSIILLGSGAQSYSWGNNVIQGASFVPPVGTTTYQVTGTSVHGCQNTANIDINVFPVPSVLAVSTDEVICEGSSTSLYAQGAVSYTWSSGITDGDTIYPPVGTNTYEVVGVDANGCVNQDTISIEVVNRGILNEMIDVQVCDVNNHVLTTSSSFIQTYQWGVIVNNQLIDLPESSAYQGTQTDELTIVEIGQGEHTYYVQMEGLCGNELIDTVVLTIHESTPIDALQDTSLCIHETNSLFADVEGSNIVWSDGTVGQYLNPTYTGWYSVSFVEPNTGCLIADSLFVEMEDCIDECVVVIPSGFSPNNDGANDVFRSINTCDEGFSYYSLMIFDRWGGLVFQTDNPEEGWDGTRSGDKSALGVYVYNLAYTKEYNNEVEQLKGNVTLLR